MILKWDEVHNLYISIQELNKGNIKRFWPLISMFLKNVELKKNKKLRNKDFLYTTWITDPSAIHNLKKKIAKKS